MNAYRLPLTLALSVFGLIAAPTVRANPYIAAEQLAGQLQNEAGHLSAEIRGNFRQAPNYGRLVSDAQQMYAFSAQLRGLARANANPNQMSASLRRIERLAADLQDGVGDASRFHVAYRGYGRPVSPCDTRLAMRMLSGFDRTLANLENVIDDLDEHCRNHPPRHGFDNDFDGRGPGGYGPNYGGQGYMNRGRYGRF